MKRQSWLTWFKKGWDEESWEPEMKVCTGTFLAVPRAFRRARGGSWVRRL